jgi:fructose transport system permease protein
MQPNLKPAPLPVAAPDAQGNPATESKALRLRLKEALPPVTVLGPLLALLAACLFFATQSDRFLSGQNFSLILQQVMVVGVIAIGQTLIILTAGIDLSCGMAMALGSVVTTKFAVDYGIHPYAAALCGMAVCVLIGYINGALVTTIKLPPFIVTLGTMNIVFAVTQIYSQAQTITGLPEALTFFGNTFHLGQTSITYGTVLMLALYLLTWLFLRETAPGRHLYAVGNNPEAARLTGIATGRVLLGVYMIAGLFYGVAALLSVARMGVGDPQGGQTDNLDSITAVVLGGTSLFGGRGSVLGTLVGVLIVGVFRNGLTLMGVPSVVQILVTGVLVILAVATDQLTHKKG